MKEEYNKLLEEIKNNKCILLLGPLMGAMRFQGRTASTTEILSNYILQKMPSSSLSNFAESTRNTYYLSTKYFQQIGGQAKVSEELTAFKKTSKYPLTKTYYSLSRLPFHTVINFGCDHLMQYALQHGGYEFKSAYYDYRGQYSQYIDNLDDSTQLIYNMFGSLAARQSLVLTELDQLEFMKQIAGPRKLPDNLLSRFKDSDGEKKSFIFLGFNFEEWPFRFLLDILQLPKASLSKAPKIPSYTTAIMTEEFYDSRFGMKLIPESPEAFASDLCTEYINKYDIDSHRYGVLHYSDSNNDDDVKIVTEFREYLKNSNLGKRIKFWTHADIIAGQIKAEEFDEKVNISTIHIVFMSNKFLIDDVKVEQLKNILSDEQKLVFPVITRNCEFGQVIPGLREQCKLLLPDDGKALRTATKVPTEDDYISLIKKINSKIR